MPPVVPRPLSKDSSNSLPLKQYVENLGSNNQRLSYEEWLRFAYNLILAYKVQYQDKEKRHNDIELNTIIIAPQSFTFIFTTSKISSDNPDPITNLYPKKSYIPLLKEILKTKDLYPKLTDFSRLIAILHKSVPVELPTTMTQSQFEQTFFEKTAGFTVEQYLSALKDEMNAAVAPDKHENNPSIEISNDPKILKMIGVLEKYETESLKRCEDEISIEKSEKINTLKDILSDTTKNQQERLELFQEKLKKSKSVFAKIRTAEPGCFSFFSLKAKSFFQNMGLFKTRGTQVAEELEAIVQENYPSKLRI